MYLCECIRVCVCVYVCVVCAWGFSKQCQKPGHQPSESFPSFKISMKSTMGIIVPGRSKSFFPSCALTCPPNTKCSLFLPMWWLLNLFLVSFDKPLCLQRDIPLTRPLVIVYTSSHQSRHALSGFELHIHFASEVQYRKWLDHLSCFLQLLPSSSPTVPQLTLT